MSETAPHQVGKLDRGQTYAPKISRRYAPGFHQKAQNFPALRAGTLQIVQKGPKFSGATRRETHHPISPHILDMSLQQPCFPTWVGDPSFTLVQYQSALRFVCNSRNIVDAPEPSRQPGHRGVVTIHP